MYNKIFTKILDSSIWLESDQTRIVWLTLLAAMDEEGHTQFASVANLARRAIVPIDAAEKAVALLEGPDPNSSDPENEGRRIERVNGGWIVLNAAKYREIVTRAIAQERTRTRVARFRNKTNRVTPVTLSNGDVTPSNVSVTPSEAVSGSDTKTESVSTNPSKVDWASFSCTLDSEWNRTLADSVFDDCEIAGWLDAKGSPIRNWRAFARKACRNWKLTQPRDVSPEEINSRRP